MLQRVAMGASVRFFRTGALRATLLGGGPISATMPFASPSSSMRSRFAAIRACRTRSYSLNPAGTGCRLLVSRAVAPQVAGFASLHLADLCSHLSPLSFLCCPGVSAGLFAAERRRSSASSRGRHRLSVGKMLSAELAPRTAALGDANFEGAACSPVLAAELGVMGMEGAHTEPAVCPVFVSGQVEPCT